MLKDNTSAENYYLSMPLFSSGVDLLANTISNLILREKIAFKGVSYEVFLNCKLEEQKEHERVVLENLKDQEMHLKKLVYLSLSATTNKEYKTLIYSSLKSKGLVKLRYFRTLKGIRERNNQRKEIKELSEIVKCKSKPEIVEMIKIIGGNVYLFKGRIQRILSTLYPKSIKTRIIIFKLMGYSGLSDTYGDLYSNWGGGYGVSVGYSGMSGFSGGGGGSFGGGGAGGSW